MLRRRVSCSVFESRPQDRTAGPHHDEWDGLIVQVRGAKNWRLGARTRHTGSSSPPAPVNYCSCPAVSATT
ncbi:JmjC domain-containing protein [Streptomyces sp. NPDC058469]|uniref:JmjC domain-containing protein n=1 Tax=Streptomyces sp. NPDC058469 TaxID=3346514 RepID=UPI0036473B18